MKTAYGSLMIAVLCTNNAHITAQEATYNSKRYDSYYKKRHKHQEEMFNLCNIPIIKLYKLKPYNTSLLNNLKTQNNNY